MHGGAALGIRIGQRTVLTTWMPLWGIVLVLGSVAPAFSLLCAAIFVAGVTGGSTDVAMNAMALHVERGAGRSAVSRRHAGWSLGGVLGALVAATAAWLGVSLVAQFNVLTAVLLVVCLAYSSGWPAREFTERRANRRRARPNTPVVVIGVLAFCAIFVGAAASEWSAVFLVDNTGTSEGLAALAVVTVATAMLAGHLLGDRAIDAIGPSRTVRAGSATVIIGEGQPVPDRHDQRGDLIAFGIPRRGCSGSGRVRPCWRPRPVAGCAQ